MLKYKNSAFVTLASKISCNTFLKAEISIYPSPDILKKVAQQRVVKRFSFSSKR